MRVTAEKHSRWRVETKGVCAVPRLSSHDKLLSA